MTTEYRLATLLINTAVIADSNPQSAFSGTKVKPSLGVTWSFCADTCILLHRSVQENIVTVEVVRSRSGVSSHIAQGLIPGIGMDKSGHPKLKFSIVIIG